MSKVKIEAITLSVENIVYQRNTGSIIITLIFKVDELKRPVGVCFTYNYLNVFGTS
jgi:hypothetical protein